ncbi:MAG: NAD(P)/FAD-dependent oxidoreductase [Clostridiales bacterium]
MSGKVIVIGAGAAGLMAAGNLAENGKDVLLIERNDRVGKKLLITGKGRCNLTNNSDIDNLIMSIPRNGNFLYSSFYNFSNLDIIDFFSKNGLELKNERGGRVFPKSDSAKDVVDLLYNYCKGNGVKILFESKVTDIIIQNKKVSGVKLYNGKIIKCCSVILATGGYSYPKTGSDGSGHDLLRKIGHNIKKIQPSLIPLLTKEKWVKDLQGLSLKNISVMFKNKNNKKIFSEFGEMIFTHFGVSGPVILSGSCHLLNDNFRDMYIYIDLKPALDEKKLEDRIIRDFVKYSRKQIKNALDDLLPKKLIPVIISLSGIPEDKFVNQITKKERLLLVKLLKGLKLEIIGSRDISEAIITAGGVSIDEIESYSMESKLVKGLYVIGELLDVDGYTGGYNLTVAFSTAMMAVKSI